VTVVVLVDRLSDRRYGSLMTKTLTPTQELALKNWREARAERDRIIGDKRFSHDSLKAADRRAEEARRAYDKAMGWAS